MTSLEYFNLSLKYNYFKDINWFYCTFSHIDKDFAKNKYVKVVNNKYLVNILEENKEEYIDDKDLNKPIFCMSDIIKIPNKFLNNLDKDITTTIGRVLANKILLEIPLNDKIPYINKEFSMVDIEPYLTKFLNLNEITIDQFNLVAKSILYLQNLSSIVTVSSTPKIITPPDNLDKFKKDLNKEFITKYGDNWTTNRVYVNEYKKRLIDFDTEYYKDDPGYNKIISKKMRTNSRVKMFLTYGDESGLNKKNKKFTFIENSLLDGYPKDVEQLSAAFESAIAGSFDRGKETQKGGAAAKDLLRAISSATIEGDDCGSSIGKEILVTEVNYKQLSNRYIINNNKSTLFTNSKDYLGKIVTIRSPMFCKSKNNTFCKTCAGTIIGMYANVSLPVLEISGKLLTTSLKSMHNTNTTNIKFEIDKWLS